MKERILRKLKNKSMSIEELSSLLGEFSSVDFIELVKTVNKLIDDKTLFEIDGKIYLSEDYQIGKVLKDKKFIYVDYDGPLEVKNAEQYYLNEGDEIIYKVTKYDALCIKVIKREPVYILGTMVLRREKLYFFSDEYKYSDYTLTNLNEFKKEIKPDYRVRALITDFKKKTIKIDKVIGHKDSPEVLINTILLMNKAPGDFNNHVKEEIKNIDSTINLENRRDLREFDFITIDGIDAKDFDDAICVYKNDDGYRLLVSIADVSHYVKEGSELDKEALSRGTSIYYPGHVIPMLPHILCDDLCSLKEGVERYTLTCDMFIGFEGNITNYDIYPSCILSKHRMTYSNVNKILEHDKELLDKYSDITQMIYNAYELSRIVDKVRKSKGGIEFESNEPIIVEKNGKVIDIKLRSQGKAEILIEDFMILANETVATHMFYLGYPLIYRNHDYPKADRITKFVKVMADLGYTFKGNKFELESSTLQKCLTSFENKPEYSLVSDMLLRSMAKAIYESTCMGHYGLGLEHYCHFTSPIRRYPDLMVHRMLKKYVFESNTSDIDADNLKNKEISTNCNITEKRATMIERSIMDLKRCEFMKDKIYQKFDAIICSVLKFGFYCELENTIEGLVHISTLPGYFEYDEENDILTDGKTTYKVGQKVKVVLIGVDLDRRNIDFEVVTKHKHNFY